LCRRRGVARTGISYERIGGIRPAGRQSSYKVENEATIKTARLDDNDAVIPRTVSQGIRHNKFIVLLNGSTPVAVWTGFTNISAGGIFGHSNVGHVVWDEEVARKYFDYWQRLADNLTPNKLRRPNKAATPTPRGKPPKNSVSPLFSARDDEESNETLQWYADRLAEADDTLRRRKVTPFRDSTAIDESK